jgi:large subunit ribosomal protein L4
VYGPDGSLTGEVALDPEVFGLEPNVPVMHQVVTAQLAAARVGSANTKSRAEVRGGGRKPWRQKGLGRARHGSRRSPIWTGGGVAHGPKPRSYAQRTPKKMRRLALRSALSARAAEGAIKVIDGLDWPQPKTKQARTLLEMIGVEGKALVVVGSGDRTATLSFRNLPEVRLTRPGHLTTYDVLWAGTVIFTADTLRGVAGRGSYEVAGDDFVKEEGDDE